MNLVFTGILINAEEIKLYLVICINGSLSGSSIRYRFLDGTNPGKLADISTSRVSAWSSSDPRANNNDLSIQKLAKISYGARVSIISGGQLQLTLKQIYTTKITNIFNSRGQGI